MKDTESRTCRKCGRTLLFEDVVCPYCGAKIRQFGVKKCLRWSAIGIAVLLVLGMLMNFLSESGILDLLEELRRDARMEEEYMAPEPEFQYYCVPEQRLEALTADAFWNHPELWDEETGTVPPEYREAVEDLAWEMQFTKLPQSAALAYLQDQGHSREEALEILDLCQVDWNLQALLCAFDYLEFSSFSRLELENQLQFDGFTPEESAFAGENCGVDWRDQTLLAVREAAYYGTFSRKTMIDRLTEAGHDRNTVISIVDGQEIDWNLQAVKCGRDYLEVDRFSREEMISQLKYEGFTQNEADYAAAYLKLH